MYTKFLVCHFLSNFECVFNDVDFVEKSTFDGKGKSVTKSTSS